jgi:hypothetical protein
MSSWDSKHFYVQVFKVRFTLSQQIKGPQSGLPSGTLRKIYLTSPGFYKGN